MIVLLSKRSELAGNGSLCVSVEEIKVVEVVGVVVVVTAAVVVRGSILNSGALRGGCGCGFGSSSSSWTMELFFVFCVLVVVAGTVCLVVGEAEFGVAADIYNIRVCIMRRLPWCRDNRGLGWS